MNDQLARNALSRMSMQPIAIAAMFTASMLVADMSALARTDTDREQAAALAARAQLCAAYNLPAAEQRKPFAFSNGYAIIPVHGTLINRFNYSWSSFTGYNFIRGQLQAAMADDDVIAIIFDCNSYGGEAAGCFELCNEIKAARAVKPSLAVVDSNCYSACYAIASSCSKIAAIPSAGIGSIGVIMAHIDMSKMLDDFGVKVTLIYEGEHKADGNPFEALPADVKKNYEASIHRSFERFCAHVADARGLDVKKVRAFQSQSFDAEDAKSNGLIDAITTPAEAIEAFSGELSGSNSNLSSKEPDMTTEAKPGNAQAGTVTQTDHQAGIAKASADAKTAERARVSGIMGCEEAKGKTKLASHLAMNTDMSLTDAQAVLKAAEPEATAAAAPAAAPATNHFAAAMDKTANPNVSGEGANPEGAAGGPPSAAAGILANSTLASGRKYDTATK